MAVAMRELMKKNIPIKLDIGCGPNKKVGFIGVDVIAAEGVDFVLDLDNANIPIDDGCVDEIYTSHFLEHVHDPIRIIKEFDRILKHNGVLRIIVPHYTNPYAYHFTHKTFWSSYSFEQQYLDYYIGTQLILISKKINIKTINLFDPLFNLLANRFPSLYERFFSTFIKAWDVEFILRKDENKRKFSKIK